ncbi:MAG: hypothetical protein M5T61_21000 [Acidimicrobiia bacterium]|nr:hypothetical protein [Acidimicrobiia bacterium]
MTDFADPRPEWQGKICLGDARGLSHSYTTLFGLYSVLGEEQTRAIYEGVGETTPTLYTGAPQAVEWITTGRCGILFQIPFLNYGTATEGGAPVEWVTPTSGMIPNTSMIGVSAQIRQRGGRQGIR